MTPRSRPTSSGLREIVVRQWRSTGLELIVEPGRFIVGNAGVLLTRVLYRKRSGGKEFMIVDAGMNDLIRPSHYNAYHRIEAVEAIGARSPPTSSGPCARAVISSRCTVSRRSCSRATCIAVHSAGAYGFAMSSNYNSRGRPAEVLVDGESFASSRAREYADLVEPEDSNPNGGVA